MYDTQGRVPLTSFNPTDIGDVQTAFISHFLLSQALLYSIFSECFSECPGHMGGGLHLPESSACGWNVLMTIVIIAWPVTCRGSEPVFLLGRTHPESWYGLHKITAGVLETFSVPFLLLLAGVSIWLGRQTESYSGKGASDNRRREVICSLRAN